MIEWFYRNVKIPKDAIVGVLDAMDTDKDGYISLGELIASLKGMER